MTWAAAIGAVASVAGAALSKKSSGGGGGGSGAGSIGWFKVNNLDNRAVATDNARMLGPNSHHAKMAEGDIIEAGQGARVESNENFFFHMDSKPALDIAQQALANNAEIVDEVTTRSFSLIDDVDMRRSGDYRQTLDFIEDQNEGAQNLIREALQMNRDREAASLSAIGENLDTVLAFQRDVTESESADIAKTLIKTAGLVAAGFIAWRAMA